MGTVGVGKVLTQGKRCRCDDFQFISNGKNSLDVHLL